jgi:hypothetical protein
MDLEHRGTNGLLKSVAYDVTKEMEKRMEALSGSRKRMSPEKDKEEENEEEVIAKTVVTKTEDSDLVCGFDAFVCDCINKVLNSSAPDDPEIKRQSGLFSESMTDMFRIIVYEGYIKKQKNFDSVVGRYTSAFLSCLDVMMYEKTQALAINNTPIKSCVACDVKCTQPDSARSVVLVVLGTTYFENTNVKLTTPVCNWLCSRHGREYKVMYYVNVFEKLFFTKLQKLNCKSIDELLGEFGKKKKGVPGTLPHGTRVCDIYEKHPSKWKASNAKDKPQAVTLIASFRETLKNIESISYSFRNKN